MPLEAANYVSNLVTSNPAGTDAQSQGDDHLRLIKTVLQATFPNASKAFRFPTDGASVVGNYTVVFPNDQNKNVRIDAAATNRTVSLPTPSGDHAPGWSVAIFKIDSSANLVTISGGTINGASSYVLRKQYQGVQLIWIDASSVWLAVPIEAEFPSTTAMLFVQTSAPPGWTKSTTHNDKALRVVSGAASSGGTNSFSSTFTSRTITQANLPNINLASNAPSGTETVTIYYDFANDVTLGGGGTRIYAIGGAGGSNFSVNPTSTHTHLVPLGGSGTAMSFAVQYVDVIIATKD